MAKVQATAVVTITVEVYVGSVWGDECSILQINDQARDEAIRILHRMKQDNRMTPHSIVGEPIVKAIVVSKEN